jgi:hypothetical protein
MAALLRDPELKPMQYDRLFALLTNPDSAFDSIRNFLEVVLVVHGVRPAAIVTIAPEARGEVAKLLERQKIGVRILKSNNCVIINLERVPYGVEGRVAYIRAHPDDHVAIGELLGYMTPVDVRSNHTCDTRAELSVEVIYDGTIRSIQLCPQVVCGRREDEIQQYYAPMASIMARFNRVFDGFTIGDVRAVIEPFSRVGGGGGRSRRSHAAARTVRRKRRFGRTNTRSHHAGRPGVRSRHPK